MAASTKRIDGIDFWRGLALLMIFIDHVPENVFQHVTQQNFGFSDAAELFVFLSGVSVALAYGTRFFDGETFGAVRAVLRRAFTIYWVQILISLLIIAIFVGAAALWTTTISWQMPTRWCLTRCRRPPPLWRSFISSRTPTSCRSISCCC